MRSCQMKFPWNKDALTGAYAVSEPYEEITVAEGQAAIKRMKNNKAAGPSGVVADMFKAACDTGVRWVTNVCDRATKEVG